MEFRRQRGGTAWHWWPECSQWPTLDYEARSTAPTGGSMDKECQARFLEADLAGRLDPAGRGGPTAVPEAPRIEDSASD